MPPHTLALPRVELDGAVSPALQRELVQLVEEGPETVPQLGRAAFELAACVAASDTGLEDAVAILRTDDRLRHRVLKLSNSGYYAGAAEIEDLGAAAVRLGFRVLWEIAIVEVARDDIFQPVLGRSIDSERYWNLASLSGLFAHELGSRRMGAQRASILGGLLADVGRPLALGALADLEARHGETIPERLVRPLASAARAACAERLIDDWKLAPDVRDAILVHSGRRPREAATEPALVSLLSQGLARHVVLRGTFRPGFIESCSASVALRFDAEELEDLLGRVPELQDGARAL